MQVLALKRECRRKEGIRLWEVRYIPTKTAPKQVRGMRVGPWRWTAPKASAESHWAWVTGNLEESQGKRVPRKKSSSHAGAMIRAYSKKGVRVLESRASMKRSKAGCVSRGHPNAK